MTQQRKTAVVEMFGLKRVCIVTVYGEQQSEYTRDQVYWVERAEDEYGIPQMKPPFCVLQRQDWLRGKKQ